MQKKSAELLGFVTELYDKEKAKCRAEGIAIPGEKKPEVNKEEEETKENESEEGSPKYKKETANRKKQKESENWLF